ncbi:MAG TPA: glycosyltransferase family 4 protein [Candidatus Saccharimonadales bacterium]|nr:glycosyltransferase family 4 protein [Candidatus Saccharimonadales bacterium]
MISFIWPPGTKLPAGTGGSENYTVGQVRELIRRGIPAQVVTVGLGAKDGRNEFIDIPFLSLKTTALISQLDGVVVFVNEAATVPTKEPAFVIMHIPPPPIDKRKRIAAMIQGRTLIATSKYAAQLWADYTSRDIHDVHIAYPFAEPCFSTQVRLPNATKFVRILFAGRLSAQKGIYTFLEMLHMDTIRNNTGLIFSVTTAGSDKPEGKIIKSLVDAHPNLTVVSARKTPAAMAQLMSVHDVVVMPSNSQYWHETFGIVSVEAQHSGVRVVASDDGGLPETDCGGVSLVTPNDPVALAEGIIAAIAKRPLSKRIRQLAAHLFTVEQSVDNLLLVLFPAEALTTRPVEKLVLKSSV